MSLLNDMLRDISQKHQVPDGSEGYDYSLLQATSITRKKRNSWLGSLLIFVSVFALVFTLNYVWHHHLKRATGSVASAPLVAQSTKSQPITHRQETAAIVPLVVKAADADLQPRIDELLRQAERALSMDRLTSPIEDNAYGYYQKILALSPTNELARQGLENIAARYLGKAQEQQQMGNVQQTEALIQRAKFVAPEFVRDQINIQLAPVVNLPVENAPSEVTANSLESSAALTGQPENRRSNQLAESPSTKEISNQTKVSSVVPKETPTEIHESIKSFKVAETQKLDVTPNADWKDEQLSQQARELNQQGKNAEAVALLKKFVVTEPAPQRSASLLANIYIQQVNYEAAEILLAHATYLPPATLAFYKAQILSGQGNNPGAISLLEKNAADAEKDEDYRALLASLYHKTGNYQQSVVSYQYLLSSFGEKPAYWLGLALAYDGLSQTKNALQAYTHLREFSQLQPQVSTYIDQRIAALRSQ